MEEQRFNVLPQASSVYVRQKETGLRGRRRQILEGNIKGVWSNLTSASFSESLWSLQAPHGTSESHRWWKPCRMCLHQEPWNEVEGGRDQASFSAQPLDSQSKFACCRDQGGPSRFHPVNHGPEVLCKGELERYLFKAAKKSMPRNII